MPHYGTVTVRDYSDETSTTRLNFGAVTAVSIGGLLTEWGNWRTALGNIILGVIGKETLVMDSTTLSNESPSVSEAQVELKFMFTYEGDTSKKKFRFEVPTPDTSKVLPGTDIVDLTDTDVAAFITATEALGRSPDSDQETITVLDARLVGRNI
jgi:hypothetical protein